MGDVIRALAWCAIHRFLGELMPVELVRVRMADGIAFDVVARSFRGFVREWSEAMREPTFLEVRALPVTGLGPGRRVRFLLVNARQVCYLAEHPV